MIFWFCETACVVPLLSLCLGGDPAERKHGFLMDNNANSLFWKGVSLFSKYVHYCVWVTWFSKHQVYIRLIQTVWSIIGMQLWRAVKFRHVKALIYLALVMGGVYWSAGAWSRGILEANGTLEPWKQRGVARRIQPKWVEATCHYYYNFLSSVF